VFTSAKIIGSAAPGYSSGEALAAMEKVATETLPEGYKLVWTGTAFQEKAPAAPLRRCS
jgi:multidrug efflux pump subunit AcrB